MKKIFLIVFSLLLSIIVVEAQAQKGKITGRVVDNQNWPLANVSVVGDGVSASSDKNGLFYIDTNQDSIRLKFYHVGFADYIVTARAGSSIEVILSAKTTTIEEVLVNTGYSIIPKDRATGSFVSLDNRQYNRGTGTDAIERLEGIANGLYFDRRYEGASASPYSTRLRGLSSIQNDRGPLIVLDNFPYEGDLKLINPNDIDQVTILKDAAASSIWGAKAGNGVIVITTKSGSNKYPLTIDFDMGYNLKVKPDLYYSRNFLSSEDFIEVERQLFDRKYYTENNWTPLSPVIELLIANRDKKISDTDMQSELERLGNIDVRESLSRYFYRQPVEQTYSIRFSGSSSRLRYYLSANSDIIPSVRVGDDSKRISFTNSLIFTPVKSLTVSSKVRYLTNRQHNNSLTETDITANGKRAIYPYAEFMDGNGNSLPIVKALRQPYVDAALSNGLLDWNHRPLDELNNNRNLEDTKSIIADFGLDLRFFKSFEWQVKYQYQQAISDQRFINLAESYPARNTINRYTQTNGDRIIPLGGIYTTNRSNGLSQSLRSQLNYNETVDKLEINGLLGTEWRWSSTRKGPGSRLYGYDEEFASGNNSYDYTKSYPILPRGNAKVPAQPSGLTVLDDRFLSYYSNIALSYDSRYVLSSSVRWDASNLYGVSINRKGVPLWSVGGKWRLAKEYFFRKSSLKNVDLRFTIGENGNMDNSLSYETIAVYGKDALTSLPQARIKNPGNKGLRWEKVRTYNIGLDIGFWDRLDGSFEYYIKQGKDLISDAYLEPTLGLNEAYKINYASITTRGVDIQLKGNWMLGDLTWMTSLNLNFTTNKVGKQDDLPITGILRLTDYPKHPREGYSLDAFYSLPWYRLNSDGDPQVKLGDEMGTNYGTYISGLKIDDLLYSGITVPKWTAFFMHSFTYKRFAASFNLAWKSGHYLRRTSINYTDLFSSWLGHEDYVHRWRNPGDELYTNIPSLPAGPDANRDNVYLKSTQLVDRADHLRLQDVRLDYSFYESNKRVKQLNVFVYANNLGVLWKAGSSKIDPDYPMARLRPSKMVSIGFNTKF